MRMFILPFLLCVCALAACTNYPRDFSAGAPQVAASPDKVSALLADASDRAARSLETLAAVESARTPRPRDMGPMDGAPPSLRRAMTVNWVGPVEPITRKLADRAGYKFITAGPAPATDIVVSVDAENTPVLEILRSIGLQLGTRADVNVDSVRSVVEIIYAPRAN